MEYNIYLAQLLPVNQAGMSLLHPLQISSQMRRQKKSSMIKTRRMSVEAMILLANLTELILALTANLFYQSKTQKQKK
jgi:hypothetical protein